MSLSVMEINDQTFSTAASGGPYTSIPSGDIGTVIRFYINWASYLHLNYGFWHSASGTFMNWIVKTIFEADKGLEAIYNSIFMLLGWEGNVAQGGPLHTLWIFFQTLGWSLLALGLTIVALQSLNHHTDWGSVATNIIMVALTMTILPMMMQMFNTIAIDAEKGLNSISNSEMTSDVAIQPIKNNVIDLSTLVRNNFNGFTYKPDSKTIKSVADWNVLHTSKDIKEMDLGQSLDNQTMKDLKLDKYKAGATAMQYHLEDEHSQTGGGYVIVKNKAGAGAGSLNDQCYARYSVNWIGLIGQALILGFVLIVAGIRVAKDSYELVLMNFIAPLLAYRSIRSTKKLRDLISSIAGMCTSIVFTMAIIRVYLISLPVCQAKVPSMNWFQRSIVILIIYIGGAVAMFAGINYLERVTGVSQGLSEEAGQMIAAGAAGGALIGAGGGMLGRTMSTTGGMISRIGNRNNSTSHHGTGGLTSNSNSMRSNNASTGQSSTMLPGQNSNESNNQGNLRSDSQINNQAQANNQNESKGIGNSEVNSSTDGESSQEINNGADNQNETPADGVPGIDGSQGDITTNTSSPDGVPGDINDGDMNVSEGDNMNNVAGTEAMENNMSNVASTEAMEDNSKIVPGIAGSNEINGVSDTEPNAIPGADNSIDEGTATTTAANTNSETPYDEVNAVPNSVAGTEPLEDANSTTVPGADDLQDNNLNAAQSPMENSIPGDISSANSWNPNDPINADQAFSDISGSYANNDKSNLNSELSSNTAMRDPILDNISSTHDFNNQTDRSVPVDNSFEGQADRLNNSSIDGSTINTTHSVTDNKVPETIHPDQSVFGNEASKSTPDLEQSRQITDVTQPSSVKFGQHMQQAGHMVSHVSGNLRQHSTNYLRNHGFNFSQSGNLHGRDSDHLE